MHHTDGSKCVKRNLPPLLPLRAFECAARHMSFTLAADELCVTQSAVSRHIKNLEAHFKLKLFNRLTREIELTEGGERLYKVVARSFDEVEKISCDLRKLPAARTLVVSILPTLASTWFMPRLAKFTQAHQNIDVRLTTSIAPVSFDRDGIDVAIRVGRPPGMRRRKGAPHIDIVMTDDWKGVSADRLFPDVLVPVCRPDLLPGKAPLKLEMFETLALIHTDSRLNAWDDWFASQNVSFTPSRRGLHFGHFFMSVRAALEGKGIALVPDVLIAEELTSGKLVVATETKVLSDGDYCLLYRKEQGDDETIASFRRWIASEVVTMRQV